VGATGKPGPLFDFGRAGVPLAVRGGSCLEVWGWKFFVGGDSLGALKCSLRPPSAELPYTDEGGGPAGVVEKCAGRSENRGVWEGGGPAGVEDGLNEDGGKENNGFFCCAGGV
jgi:hypothetical protein